MAPTTAVVWVLIQSYKLHVDVMGSVSRAAALITVVVSCSGCVGGNGGGRQCRGVKGAEEAGAPTAEEEAMTAGRAVMP